MTKYVVTLHSAGETFETPRSDTEDPWVMLFVQVVYAGDPRTGGDGVCVFVTWGRR